MPIQRDVVILGGGIAGLWTLDALRRAGHAVMLVERDALGAGQTIWSQGIIHGGLKYTLDGALSPSARAIREMPAIWRRALTGEAEPSLGRACVRAEQCWLWRTASMRSRLGMLGARIGLRTPVNVVEQSDRPEVLCACPGTVASLDEQVIDTAAVLARLRERNIAHLAHAPPDDPAALSNSAEGITVSLAGGRVRVAARTIVLAAGGGNEALRRSLGLEAPAMQIRDLHMAMARGDLPMLNGHCVDGARTRLTITSIMQAPGDVVWQLGGEIAERGVAMEPGELIQRAKAELVAVLPGLRLDGVHFATYRAPRAEGLSATGARPEDVVTRVEGDVITVWPTKLALAPRAATRVLEALSAPRSSVTALPDLPRPAVAKPPWENAAWT